MAPPQTTGHDSCDKTHEHKQQGKRARGNRQPRSCGSSNMRQQYWLTHGCIVSSWHIRSVFRGVLLSLGKVSDTLTDSYGCEDNPHFWSHVCLCGQRNQQSWEVSWKQMITFNSFRIFKAMQLLAKSLNLGKFCLKKKGSCLLLNPPFRAKWTRLYIFRQIFCSKCACLFT